MNKEKIVIYTGSFNPLTRGHFLTMKAALDTVGADKGMFVVTPNQYLTRKMYFKVKSNFILSEDTRKEMIESLNLLDSRMCFGGKEVGGSSPSTVKTINSIRRRNKNSDLYLLIGADKLRKLPRWDEIDLLINDIKIIVAVRNGFDINEIILADEWLTIHKDKFVIVNPNPVAFNISSTKVRELFFNGENYSDLMTDGAYNILQTFTPDDFKELSTEDLIFYHLKYNGRFGSANACKLVYESNSKIFKTWDEELLGNKEYKLNNTKLYREKFTIDKRLNYELVTDCVNQDCADVALELIRDGYNPAILNLASNTSPGGGYHKGTNAQEECICQMSTLSQSLYQFGSLKYKHIRDAELPNFLNGYPLDINYGGIYSPDVTFFRHNKSHNFQLRDEVFSCSIISVASLSNRKKNEYTNDERKYFDGDGYLTNEGREIELNKIRTIFRIALDNNHDSLVLGAFGCGVYNLHSSEVSRLFYDVLNEPEFKGNFKKIVFAILERKGKNGSKPGANGKFKPFYDLFLRKL